MLVEVAAVTADWLKKCLISLPPDRWNWGSACLVCRHGGLVHSAAVWGFVLCCIVFPLHLSRLDSKASGVPSAQLHPPLVARFTLEVAGVEF